MPLKKNPDLNRKVIHIKVYFLMVKFSKKIRYTFLIICFESSKKVQTSQQVGQALGIPVGPLNDKKTVNVPLSQVGVFSNELHEKKPGCFLKDVKGITGGGVFRG